MTNTALLQAEIEKSGLKLKKIADFLGLSYDGLRLKINNERKFNAEEIQKMCTILGIKDLRVKEDIFFAQSLD